MNKYTTAELNKLKKEILDFASIAQFDIEAIRRAIKACESREELVQLRDECEKAAEEEAGQNEGRVWPLVPDENPS